MPVFWILLSILAHATKISSANPEAPPRNITACVAVTGIDIEEALGRAVTRLEAHADKFESTCEYASGDGRVTIVLRHSAARVNIPREMETLAAALPEARRRDVPGFGTRAFFMDLPGIGTQLNIFREEHDYLLVSVLGLGEADQVSAAAGKLARKALGRL